MDDPFRRKPVGEDAMKRWILASAVAAIGLSCATGLQAQTGDQTPPPIGGGYTNCPWPPLT